MNTKFLSVIAAMILIVNVSVAHATPLESLIQISGAENYWLVTPAMNGIEGTTALLEQVALTPVKPRPCPKGKVCLPQPCRPPKCRS